MFKGKLCVIVGAVNLGSLVLAGQFAKLRCNIAFMDSNKYLGKSFVDEISGKYGVKVFFFHGSTSNEEDLDIFRATVLDQYGHVDFFINGEDIKDTQEEPLWRMMAYPASGEWKFVF